MQLQGGTLLHGGSYRIIETLGRGGFGVTYLAEQVSLHRRVCIKEFFPKDYYKRDGDTGALTLSSDGFGEMMGKFKAKFVKEAQTIATLNHANIIPIHDVFEENNTCYYVMEYIEGESLSSIVKGSGALSEDVAVGYIKQVASALEHIHEQQIMHLDVKPGNIMVRSKDDRAILIDFGLSKHYDATSGEATSTTPVGVSHGYAPMEQYKQGGVNRFSPETDIYSLGATLYYLVTGNVPPQATDIPEEGIVFPTDMSLNIRETIAKSMSYLRKDRPHTIKDFLALLDNEEPIVAVLADESEKTKIAPQTPAPKRESNEDKPKQKKHRWWMWLLILLLIGGGAWFIFGDNKEEKNTESEALPETSAPYKVGDLYNENGKQGVVFEVWDNGRHGKIVSLDEAHLQWCTDKQYAREIALGLTDKSDGKANTDKVMQGGNSDQYPAFVWCRNKGADWYLPAIDELEAILNNESAINSTLAEYGTGLDDYWYWSSTEDENNPKFCAWGVNMSSGYTDLSIKDNFNYVRAVSAF
ncbi:MAG: DUF1566 domain-containing protein [Rikenellaceae bacterium]|nr:DUF1566 domain-containing protein [Rikenellaceae bacterium]